MSEVITHFFSFTTTFWMNSPQENGSLLFFQLYVLPLFYHLDLYDAILAFTGTSHRCDLVYSNLEYLGSTWWRTKPTYSWTDIIVL